MDVKKLNVDRRNFLRVMLSGAAGVMVTSLVGCDRELTQNLPQALPQVLEGSPLLGLGPTNESRKEITLYDTNAMALYFDGGLGPKTGIIRVSAVVESKAVLFTFWHGHGGRSHLFTVLPEHFAVLKKLKRVTIETTEVDGHTHKLFIDPVEARYRVSGAKPVIVTVEG